MNHSFYFAFPDGVLHYDCARCTALCCRGQGIAVHQRDLVQLLARAPKLQNWATSRNRNIVHFQSPTGACYFLDAHDRCSIEDRKPSLCKAFPFNRIAALGATRVVMPHLLCPLQLQLPASGERAGDHARLGDALARDGWLDQDFSKLALAQGETEAGFLAAEQAFREQCTRALASGTGFELGADIVETASFMGWELAPESSFDAWFYALAPSWSVEHSARPECERRRALALARVHMWNALQMPGVRSTLQIHHNFWSGNMALYELLAQFDRPMRAGCLIDTGDTAGLLAAAVIDRAAQRGASVLEALREGCSDLDPIDRQVFLSALALMLRKRVAKA